MIEKLTKAIKAYEGWKVGEIVNGRRYNGSISWRNCNEGNLRSSPFQSGTAGGFAKFPTEEAGHHALVYQITLVCTGRSSVYTKAAKKFGLSDSSKMTLQQFFSVYAPSSDRNHPLDYANFVIQRLGVWSTTTMRDILEMV